MPGRRKCLEGENAWKEKMPGRRKCLEGDNAWREIMPGGRKCLEGKEEQSFDKSGAMHI